MEKEWKIDKHSAEKAKESIASIPQALKKWDKFETDVTDNPYYHPKPRRIEKIRSREYPAGTWRYRNDPLRVVYYPQKADKTVYPLDAGSASDITYKRRSHKK